MILKLLSRRSLSGLKSLLQYIQDHDKSKDGKLVQLLHNVRSKTADGQVREYFANEANRKVFRKDAIFFSHEIISFSPDSREHITLDMLKDIGQKYIELRASKALCVGSIHAEGKNHYHLHFCTSGLEVVTGKSTHVARPDLQKIKRELQAYYIQKYPQLEKSTVRHGLGAEYPTQKEYQAKLRSDRKLKKEEIAQTVRSLFAQSTTQNEFLEKLQNEGLPFYSRKGIPQGIVFRDLKFRFSRLEISIHELPLDRTKEANVLHEILDLRKKILDKNKTKNRIERD